MKILILASNPRKDLNIDDEIRDLKEVIEKSRSRQQFDVENALAVRVGDLQDLLLKHQPQVVHFCGHGSGKQGLVFKSNDGREQWVQADALSDLFRLFSRDVGCVLLNACYSQEQANAIVDHIDWNNLAEAIPAFLVILIMPLTFSVADGMAMGLIADAASKMTQGKKQPVSPPLAGNSKRSSLTPAGIAVAYFLLIALQS